ncbi:MAG: peptidoglycan recognition protein family protein [Hyphomicrobiaceae bacterium]|nr:peptidoglycan recognition protein family protein [Hyphomicrobiaceae bacterium]
MNRYLTAARLFLPGLLFMVTAAPAAMAAPDILTRSQWGAKPPSQKMIPQKLARITIHHSGVRVHKGNLKRKMRNLQSFSQRRERLASGKMKVAWADIPYHFYIAASGQIAQGRNLKYAGDTNTNYNPRHHIQIVLEGNFMKTSPTKAQLQNLEELLVMLTKRWEIPARKIEGHKHYAQTLCPGKKLYSQIPTIRQHVAQKLGK